MVVNLPSEGPSTTPYAPLSKPKTYLPDANLPSAIISSSRLILVKNWGSKYVNPNVVLYTGFPFSNLPLEITESESSLNPLPLSINVILLGLAKPMTGVIVSL